MQEALRVYVTGGSGYIGHRLIHSLLQHDCEVTALVRKQSAAKLPEGCRTVVGSALRGDDYRGLTEEHTLVHLVGTPHPAPWKGKQFHAVDKASFYAALEAAREADIRHFVYLSVAHPAPVMREYTAIRHGCEESLLAAGLRSVTIMKPWYVLGPGHTWPHLLRPLYSLAEKHPGTRDSALRLGLVTIQEMVESLTAAVLQPPREPRILDVPAIRRGLHIEEPFQVAR